MKIDWTKWSAIAEILSAVAILITLLYLGVQTKYVAEQTELSAQQIQQNNELLEAQARADQRDARKAASLLLLSDVDIGSMYYRSSSGEPLDAEEQFYFRQYVTLTFIDWEWQFGEFRAGMLSYLPTTAWRGILERQPYFREQWDRWSNSETGRAPEFIRFMNEDVLAE